MPSPHDRRRFLSMTASTALAIPLLGALSPTTASAAGASAKSPLFERFPLDQSGDNGVHTYRIPALTVAKDGTLVASYDARNNSAADLPADIDVMVRRSSDSGRTWTDPVRAVSYSGEVGAGDTSLLTDRETGRVFMFYAYGPHGIGFANSKPGNSPEATDTLHPHYVWSDDHGASWQGPRDLIADIKDASWQGMFATSGHGTQTSQGRLLQPFVYRGSDGVNRAANAYSDDHGETWNMGPEIGTELDENKVVELVDGTVMQNIRAGGEDKCRLVARSQDGGLTFDEPTPDEQLPDPQVNAGIIRVDPDASADSEQAHWLLFVNPANTSERRDLTVRLSQDDGRSWPVSKLVHEGEAMYSTIVRLPDDNFGIFYENGTNVGMTFVRFNLEWLTSQS